MKTIFLIFSLFFYNNFVNATPCERNPAFCNGGSSHSPNPPAENYCEGTTFTTERLGVELLGNVECNYRQSSDMIHCHIRRYPYISVSYNLGFLPSASALQLTLQKKCSKTIECRQDLCD